MNDGVLILKYNIFEDWSVQNHYMCYFCIKIYNL
jgi:hypothetical protein